MKTLDDIKLDLESSSFKLDNFLSKVESSISLNGHGAKFTSYLKALILIYASIKGVKEIALRDIKASKKSSDLSSSILVDIDTREELLRHHLNYLLNEKDKNLFEANLVSGMRLGEEFLSVLLLKTTSFQRLVSLELSLDPSHFDVVMLNLSKVNTYLSNLIKGVREDYDAATQLS